MPPSYADIVFADPPYRLSGGGVTVKSGRIASVDKGEWDRSLGSFEKDHEWNVRWLREARRVLKPDGTLWVSGTHQVIQPWLRFAESRFQDYQRSHLAGVQPSSERATYCPHARPRNKEHCEPPQKISSERSW